MLNNYVKIYSIVKNSGGIKIRPMQSPIFLNQAHAGHGVRLVSRNHFRAAKVCVCVCMCVCVCVCPPPRL